MDVGDYPRERKLHEGKLSGSGPQRKRRPLSGHKGKEKLLMGKGLESRDTGLAELVRP